MMRRSIRWRRGFTLIELLVVVAIIALLISILLPSLSEAREQVKVAKCLANYRQLMTATTMYFMDWNDGYPYMTTNPSGNGICSWQYGGKTCDDYWREEDSSAPTFFSLPFGDTEGSRVTRSTSAVRCWYTA